jgi:hypothetical protein
VSALFLKHHTGTNNNLVFAGGGKTADIPGITIENIKGRWSDFIVRIKYSSSSSGIVEVWYKDGSSSQYTLKHSASGLKILTGYNTREIAFGLYRSNQPASRTLYFHNVKVGTTRTDVEYRR